jgi:hypothetical protein
MAPTFRSPTPCRSLNMGFYEIRLPGAITRRPSRASTRRISRTAAGLCLRNRRPRLTDELRRAARSRRPVAIRLSLELIDIRGYSAGKREHLPLSVNTHNSSDIPESHLREARDDTRTQATSTRRAPAASSARWTRISDSGRTTVSRALVRIFRGKSRGLLLAPLRSFPRSRPDAGNLQRHPI